MKPIIIISGGAGTGKSTVAKAVAKALKLRHVSAGDKMRELAREIGFKSEGEEFVKFQDYVKKHKDIDKKLDKMIIDDVSKGNCVVDSRLAAYLVKNADYKILLKVPERLAAERIALREGVSIDEALKQNNARNKKEWKRYKKLYKIDINDLSPYDLVLDTSKFSIKNMNKVAIFAVKTYIKGTSKVFKGK